jgi:hypothetical protein
MHIQPLQSKWSNNWGLPIESTLCNVKGMMPLYIFLRQLDTWSNLEIICKAFPYNIFLWCGELHCEGQRHQWSKHNVCICNHGNPCYVCELKSVLTSKVLTYSNGTLEEYVDFRHAHMLTWLTKNESLCIGNTLFLCFKRPSMCHLDIFGVKGPNNK